MESSSTQTGASRNGSGSTPQKSVQNERYYYTTNKLFEQSFDIYRPADASKKTSYSSPPPIVALVVGSAWLGHRSFIYTGTSWWNSSGPKAVADLGYVCVCIRHRGAFMKSSSILTTTAVALMVAMLAAILNSVVDEALWVSLENMVGEKMFMGRAGRYLLAFATGLALIELGNIGSATFEDMQNDVMDALFFLNDNEERLQLTGAPVTRAKNGDTKSKKRNFIFGGYSSGGHVAATVMQQPHLWTERSLPPPHVHCDSILFISGVLSTSSTPLPSLTSSSGEGSSTGQLSRKSSMTETSVASLSKSPTWLTDRIITAVFGNGVDSAIPSPINTYHKSPSIPHVFLGCQNEMFGLNWLDRFFCSALYCDLLNDLGVESRYTTVKSDHWNILGSTQLRTALRNELEWIELKCKRDK